MSNILDAKKSVVDEIKTKITNAQSVVVFEYQGLSVKQFEVLRNNLRKEGVESKVFKNRLAKLAATQAGFEELGSELIGANAIAFSNEDAVAAARILANFAKANESVKINNGVFEGAVVSTETVVELSTLPSREGLLSMLLSCLQAPVRDLAMIVDAVAIEVGNQGVATANDLVKK
ncbi:MAG: 50S ribosomal protein L10 [Bacilli bacterium]